MSSSEPPVKKAKLMGESNGKSGNGAAAKDDHFDPNLYSRQLYALGETAMRKLRTSRVLVSGMNGVGVEIAKNLILGGVRTVTIHDTGVATAWDLGANYYLTEKSLGKNRVEEVKEALGELNDSVTLCVSTGALGPELVAQHDLTVVAAVSYAEATAVNAWTRAAGKKFLYADTHGLFSLIFNDFGAQHRVEDADGEQVQETIIEHMDKTTGLVICLEDARHGLEDGDHVQFSEVKGLPELNGAAPATVKVKSPSQFTLDPEVLAKMPGSYLEGGKVKLVKMPKNHQFLDMAAATAAPEHMITDFAKMERPPQLHLLWSALDKLPKLPSPGSKDDAVALLAAAKELNESWPAAAKVETIDESLASHFAWQAQSQLCPLAGFVGGMAAQEAMKGITGLYTPVNQFAYFDALECLPAKEWSAFPSDGLSADDVKPKGNRYDSLAAVFGWSFVDAMKAERWFIVGAGAIGCELLKNFAMLGLGCGPLGKILVTDMDQIELSNLNRQFLFRRHDVGSKKSECAAKAAKAFNRDMNITALSERVGGDTESLFNDDFFSGLSGVANALDNVDARTYMDRRCVFYELPLLESGTMGPKGNTQVVYPHLTESYSSSTDPPEKSIPICTLKNFPNAIEHTIQWARDQFEGLFSNPAETANQFLKDERTFHDRLEKMHTGQKIEMLDHVVKALVAERPKSSKECVLWARLLFEENFNSSIQQLLYNFPEDQVTAQGIKFWSGAKRCPKPIDFDASVEEHLDFVFAAAFLRSEVYGLKPIADRAVVAKLASTVKVPPFKPRAGVKIAVTEEEAKSNDGGEMDDGDALERLMLALARLKTEEKTALDAVDFEKDDDSNHHVEWITACSNLRAANYSIQPADRTATKKTAGRIIPALATTTAAVAGLVSIELLKIVAAGAERKIPLELFKNTFLNLALPFVASSEPIAAPKKKYNNKEFTLWDSIKLDGPMTLQEFVDYFKKEHGLELSMLSVGVSMIFSFFMNGEKKKKRLGSRIGAIVEEVTGKAIPEHQKVLVLEPMLTDADDEDVDTPYVKYFLPKQ